MRVLQVINSLKAGGAEKLLIDAIQIYTEKGLFVDLLLLDGARTDFYKKLQERTNIEIYDLGIDNDVYALSNIFKIRKYLNNYDIVHVHLFPSSYYVALASLGKNTRCKFVFTEHNTTNRRRDLILFKPLERFIYSRYDAIVSISDAVHKSLQAHLGKLGSRIQKIYNGINLTEIHQAEAYSNEELGFSHNVKLLLQVSSFTPQKDQETLINSLNYLNVNYHLLLVGEGPLKSKLEKFAEKKGLTNRVSFLGFRNDVARLVKSVDVVILSSRFEGLSLSSVEGLASTKPFIASDVPGLNDVVRGAGILFPQGESKTLAENIQWLEENPAKSKDIVEACLDRSKNFDISEMADKYIELYKLLN